MMNFLVDAFDIINSKEFALFSQSLSLFVKIIICVKLYHLHNSKRTDKRLFRLLFIVLLGEISSDCAWILRITCTFFSFPLLGISYVILRLAWGLYIIGYQAFALFIQKLADSPFKTVRNYVTCTISALVAAYFLVIAFLYINSNYYTQRSTTEIIMMKWVQLYIIFIMALSIYYVFEQLKQKQLPIIVNKQLKAFLIYLIIPKLLLEFLNIDPSMYFSTRYLTMIPLNNYAVINSATLLALYIFYFCAQKIMGLRFLNIHHHVTQKTHQGGFIDEFKNTLERLSSVTSLEELNTVTQHFFHTSFTIPPHTVTLSITGTQEPPSLNPTITGALDTAINTNLFEKRLILVRDELEFNNFYTKEPHEQLLISFLKTIHADIVIPLYEHTSILGVIIIAHNARAGRLFTNIDYDQMLVYASYLGKVINLIKNRNLLELLQRQKELSLELEHTHQKLKHYQEGLRNCLYKPTIQATGILSYKHQKLIPLNQTVQELIGFNLSEHSHHPLTKTLINLAQKIQQYKLSTTTHITNTHGVPLVVEGIVSVDHYPLLLVYQADTLTALKEQFNALKDPATVDYLMYLETTESGKLINKLLPGSSEALLQTKINLLKAVLSQKALLLDVASDDLDATIELINHISLRTHCEVITLDHAEKNKTLLHTLCGSHPLIQHATTGLLESLHNTGSICIKNAHFLSHETQEMLAHYLTTGMFKPVKSTTIKTSNVRIILTYNPHIPLIPALKQATITIPPLLNVPMEELNVLADGLTQQAIKDKTFLPTLALNSSDKAKLLHEQPLSLAEFRERVMSLLNHKAKKILLDDEKLFNPSYSIVDPELARIVSLGKKALQDQNIMLFLWNKFQNQAKIATLLNVNRSSVNRRCKQFQLTSEQNNEL